MQGLPAVITELSLDRNNTLSLALDAAKDRRLYASAALANTSLTPLHFVYVSITKLDPFSFQPSGDRRQHAFEVVCPAWLGEKVASKQGIAGLIER